MRRKNIYIISRPIKIKIVLNDKEIELDITKNCSIVKSQLEQQGIECTISYGKEHLLANKVMADKYQFINIVNNIVELVYDADNDTFVSLCINLNDIEANIKNSLDIELIDGTRFNIFQILLNEIILNNFENLINLGHTYSELSGIYVQINKDNIAYIGNEFSKLTRTSHHSG